jgi:hypothetical protein
MTIEMILLDSKLSLTPLELDLFGKNIGKGRESMGRRRSKRTGNSFGIESLVIAGLFICILLNP